MNFKKLSLSLLSCVCAGQLISGPSRGMKKEDFSQVVTPSSSAASTVVANQDGMAKTATGCLRVNPNRRADYLRAFGLVDLATSLEKRELTWEQICNEKMTEQQRTDFSAFVQKQRAANEKNK